MLWYILHTKSSLYQMLYVWEQNQSRYTIDSDAHTLAAHLIARLNYIKYTICNIYMGCLVWLWLVWKLIDWLHMYIGIFLCYVCVRRCLHYTFWFQSVGHCFVIYIYIYIYIYILLYVSMNRWSIVIYHVRKFVFGNWKLSRQSSKCRNRNFRRHPLLACCCRRLHFVVACSFLYGNLSACVCCVCWLMFVII